MSENKIRTQLPDGSYKDGVEVPIDESTERWSEIKLTDETIIRVKQTVVQVVRVDGVFDPEGNPMYIVKSAPTIAIASVNPRLKKQ